MQIAGQSSQLSYSRSYSNNDILEDTALSTSAFVASRSNLPEVQKVMDMAFVNDPTVLWYSDSREVLANEHHRYVGMCAEPAFDHDGVHATSDFEAAAIWYPPGIGVTDADFERFKKTLRFPEKLAALGDLAEACDEYRPKEPHWTLELIAVDPSAQGKGLGGILMNFGLALCDRQKMPTYFASSNPRNLSFYERLGFERVAEVRMPDMPTMYPMIRRQRT
jgi:GNAT superfamily N-acetyltransferase